MNRKASLALSALAIVALSSCQQEAPPPAAPAEAGPAAVAEAPATPPSSKDPGAYEAFTPSGPALDHRAFAGRFSGTLPCASCPGIDTTLVLKDDYSFELTEVHQDSKDPAVLTKGTWTAEEDGHRIRLDPDSKAAEDRLFKAVANDEVQALDKDGNAIESSANLSLRRGTASQ